MSSYFDFSQRVRQEIIADTGLMNAFLSHYSKPLGCGLNRIGGGKKNCVFKVGQRRSGLWVALRERDFSRRLGRTPVYLNLYESHCRNAERLSEQGMPVTRFCIGITYGEAVGLVLEDLTHNGEISEIPHELTDLDDDRIEGEHFAESGELIYMADFAMIHLSQPS